MNPVTTLERIANSLEAIAAFLYKNIKQSQDPIQNDRQTFDEFAQYYFEKFRWRKVKKDTMRSDLSRYNNHIAPVLGNEILSDIKPEQIQNIVDSLASNPKTAHEVYGLCSLIFQAAIKHNLITHNPCDLVLILPYEKEHGKALTKNEEQQLLAATSGTPYHIMFAVALYAGLRPNEYKTAYIEDGFIVAKNSKQKDGKEHKKKIPITPILAKYISDAESLHFYCVNRIREKFKSIFPDHKLYDLRTTFYTRCQECGVSEVARKLFVGHSLGDLADTYTDVSDEYLKREAQKLVY